MVLHSTIAGTVLDIPGRAPEAAEVLKETDRIVIKMDPPALHPTSMRPSLSSTILITTIAVEVAIVTVVAVITIIINITEVATIVVLQVPGMVTALPVPLARRT